MSQFGHADTSQRVWKVPRFDALGRSEGHSDYDPFEVAGEENKVVVPRPFGYRRHVSKSRMAFEQDLLAAAGSEDPENADLIRPSAKRKKPADHNARTAAYYEKHGGMYARVEFWNTTFSGVNFKRDLFGIFDGLAFFPGYCVGIQIKSKSAMGSALRDMMQTSKKGGGSTVNPRANTMRFLELGHLIEIIGWEQPDGRLWVPKIRPVTIELCEEWLGKHGKN